MKYLITIPSKARGVLYAQDPEICADYFWTQFEDNALEFVSRKEAETYARENGIKFARYKRVQHAYA